MPKEALTIVKEASRENAHEQHVVVNGNTGLVISILALVFAALCLGIALWAKAESARAQTRADLLQVEVESFKNVLHAYNLPTTAHLKGESP